MTWKPLVVVSLSLSTVAFAQAPQPQPPRPILEIAGESVKASGLTPGGPVVWFSVWREVVEYSSRYSRREAVGGADRLGNATFTTDETLPAEAIWVVVDLTSGTYALAALEGSPLQLVAPQSTANRRPEGEPDEIVDRRSFLEGLVVRPGEGGGAWGFTGGDGGAIDDDRTVNGRLVVSLAKIRPLGTSPAAPPKLGERDLWFVIDPYAMTISVQRGGVAP